MIRRFAQWRAKRAVPGTTSGGGHGTHCYPETQINTTPMKPGEKMSYPYDIKEIRHAAPHGPIRLIGQKRDLEWFIHEVLKDNLRELYHKLGGERAYELLFCEPEEGEK